VKRDSSRSSSIPMTDRDCGQPHVSDVRVERGRQATAGIKTSGFYSDFLGSADSAAVVWRCSSTLGRMFSNLV
jgi:hypothetical protein